MKRSRLDALILEQEQVHTLDRETIEAIQLKKLNRLLAREKERGGYYRHLPESLDRLADLASLPFTTGEDLARHASGMLLCSQSAVQRVITDATSGTTGASKRVFYTEGDLENTVRLYAAGLGELIGPGGVTMICFPFSGPFGLGELIAEAVTRLGARPLRLGPALSYGECRWIMEQERPDTFVGMPVQLLSILRVCGKGSLRRALVSGDACPDSVIRACEAILGSRLFPHYGSREMGMAGAITCPAHEGMHLRENHVIAEIIDRAGRPLPLGETGELVITTIGMEAMPLIRYRTGDHTRILPEPCPCGSAVLRLDSLQRKDTERMSALDQALFRLSDLVDFQAELNGDVLTILARVLNGGHDSEIRARARGCFPETEIMVITQDVNDDDRMHSMGKRALKRL